jgi:hypothetical protein
MIFESPFSSQLPSSKTTEQMKNWFLALMGFSQAIQGDLRFLSDLNVIDISVDFLGPKAFTNEDIFLSNG